MKMVEGIVSELLWILGSSGGSKDCGIGVEGDERLWVADHFNSHGSKSGGAKAQVLRGSPADVEDSAPDVRPAIGHLQDHRP